MFTWYQVPINELYVPRLSQVSYWNKQGGYFDVVHTIFPVPEPAPGEGPEGPTIGIGEVKAAKVLSKASPKAKAI
jgi:hypothetical protein